MSKELAQMVANMASDMMSQSNSAVCWLNLFVGYVDELVEKAKKWRAEGGPPQELADGMVSDALSYLAKQEAEGKLEGATAADMEHIRKKLLQWKEALPHLPVWK